MKLDDIADLVCGNEECRERILPLLSFFMDIEELIRRIKSPEIIKMEKPLIDNISLSNDVLDELSQYPEEIKSYIIARKVADSYSKIFNKYEGFCPICGQTPKAIFLRKVDSDLYSGYKGFLRCICGYETPWEDWRCPLCGAEGRDKFETYILNNRVLIERCLKCGFKTYSLSDFSEKLIQLYNLMLYKIDEEVVLPGAEKK